MMIDPVVLTTLDRLFKESWGPQDIEHTLKGLWPAHFWDKLEESGFLDILLEGPLVEEFLALLRLSGRFGVLAPIQDTVLGRLALHRLGLQAPKGPLGLLWLKPGLKATLKKGKPPTLYGMSPHVPFGRHLGKALVFHQDSDSWIVGLLDIGNCNLEEAQGLSGAPNDTLWLGGVSLEPSWKLSSEQAKEMQGLFSLGRLGSLATMAGAMERMLEMSLDYTKERIQFGRPIAKFQAIQHMLAQMAEEVLGALSALTGASQAYGSESFERELGAAQIFSFKASTRVYDMAHQVHGAIGFTDEYPLGRFTRLLLEHQQRLSLTEKASLRLGRQAIDHADRELWSWLSAFP